MAPLSIAQFFHRSIRNKLVLTLSTILTFVQLVAFSLSTLFLYHQIQQQSATPAHGTVLQGLLLTQTATMVVIAVVVVLASIATVAIITHLISEPIKRLTEASHHVAQSSTLQLPDQLSNRQDEVGFIARHMNHLLATIRQQTRMITETTAHATLGQLARQVAHDIQSPLTSIRIAAQHLRRQAAPGSDDKILGLLEMGCGRLEVISRELIDHRAQPVTTSCPWFPVDEVCEELLREFRLQPLGAGVEFICTHEVRPLTVPGNRTGLQRAFGNLVKNSLEALQKVPEDRPRRLAINSRIQNEHVVVEISDTGPGIPPHVIPKILQGGYTAGKADGHGIGMQVVRDVIASHGGTISCDSAPGAGTLFRIMLPREQGAPTPSTCVLQ